MNSEDLISSVGIFNNVVNVEIDDPAPSHREAATASIVADVHYKTCNCLLGKVIEKWPWANIKLLVHTAPSSCLEWGCTYPLLEEAGFEIWVVDVLGWCFSDLDFPSLMPHQCNIICTCFGSLT
ncbi:unnamed protein product [Ilex paraguariensis]|uniref:Uncharacterized protein n=1 Tax=Ilex paraguariensis TaxID=185542 RepID=A0ABC8RQX5_9AQUA